MMESDDRGLATPAVHGNGHDTPATHSMFAASPSPQAVSSEDVASLTAAAAAPAPSGSAAAASASASAPPHSAAPSPPPLDPSTLPLNHYMSQTCLPALRERLELFSLYETKSKLYLVGSPLSGAYYRILKIDRLQADYARLLNAQSNAFCDDGLSYDAAELAELLRMIDQGNASVGGLKELARNAVGIIGFVRFLQGFYLILATSRKLVARIGGHRVYEVTGTEMFALTHASVYTPDKAPSASSGMSLMDKLRGKDKEAVAQEKLKKTREAETAEPSLSGGPAINANSSKIKTNESKYKSLFQGLDLNKCFYFCPTGYELTQSLQANMLHAGRQKKQTQQPSAAASTASAPDLSSVNAAAQAAAISAAAPPPPPMKSMYLWNHFLLSKFYRVMAGQAREEAAEGAETGDGGAATGPAAEPAWDDEEEPEGRDDEMGPDSEAACDAAIPHTAVGVAVTRSSPASCRAYLNPAAQWALPLIHGYFVQTHVSVFGSLIDLTLLARRSRFFAGTRYLKRGINNAGRVANDVESEQIVWTRSRGSHLEGAYTSYVQVRGSIPLFWSQEGNPLVAQPAIVVTKTDPLHLATRCHTEDLFRRYGSPLLVLNLVKQSEKKKKRESIIGEALAESIEFINKFIDKPEHKIDFLAWDFKRVSQSKTHSVVDELGVISQWSLQRTGLFHSRPHPRAFPTSSQSTVSVRPTRESIRQRVSLLDGAGHQITAEKASHLSAKPHRQRQFYSLIAQMAAHAAANSTSSSSSGGATDASTLVSTALTGPIPRHRFNAAGSYPMPVYPVHHLGFLQRGVVRTNCIDSLDRTNVAQFCLGKCALGYQLFALGVTDSVQLSGAGSGGGRGEAGGSHHHHHHHHHDPSATPSSSGVSGGASTRESASSEIVNILLDLYEGMGDELSQQYGGSAMHRQIRTGQSKDGKNTLTLTQSKSKTDTKELVVSIRRHIQNSFQDNGKQDAINLFLGYFTPPDPAHMAALAAGSVIGATETPKSSSSALPSIGTFFPFTMLDHSSSVDASASMSFGGALSTTHAASSAHPVANLGLNLPQHQWDLASDWYLHNPHTINVLNKMQYNVRATQREEKRKRAVQRIQRRKQRAAELAAQAQKKGSGGGGGLPSSAHSVIPRCSPWASLLSSARAGLELGHAIYPDQSWWRNPIRDFERQMKGYLPEWLMSFPETEEQQGTGAEQNAEAQKQEAAAAPQQQEGVDGLKFAASASAAAPTVAASSTAEGVPSSAAAAKSSELKDPLLLMAEEDDDEDESSKESSRAASPTHHRAASSTAIVPAAAAAGAHHPPLYYSNVHGAAGLSSFDELLAPDVYKNHNIRILSAAPGAASGFASSRGTVSTPSSSAAAAAATPSSGYSSLIPRFLWRRQKAEDEDEDEEGDDDAAPSVAPLSGIATDASMLDSPHSSSLPPQQLTSGDQLALPTSWLDPSQRPATSSQLLDGSGYLARFDESDPAGPVIGPRPLGSAPHHHARESISSINFNISGGSTDDLPGASAISPPGSAHGYLAVPREQHFPGGHVLGNLASPSNHASHFSASGPAPRLAASQADAINTAAVYLEYMHAPYLAHLSTAPLTHKSTLLEKHGALTATDNEGGPADAAGSTTFVLTSAFPTAHDRKLLHYLEHYTNIRVEHNLIVEPHTDAQLRGQREAIAASAAAVGAALRANFARQMRMPPPVPSKLKPSKRPSHVPALPPNFVSSNSGSGSSSSSTANGTIVASPSTSPLPSMSDHPNLMLDLPVSPPGHAIPMYTDGHGAPAAASASPPQTSNAAAAAPPLTFDRADSMPEQPALTLSSPGPIPPELLSPAVSAQANPPTMGPPPTPLSSAPVFSPASASLLAPSNDRRLSSTPSGALMSSPPVVLPGVPPPLPPRKGEGHRNSLSVDQSGSGVNSLGVLTSDGFANGGGVPGGVSVPVFSHAPASSSITIRNQKKAAFYSAYLRRGEWDADFLSSAFEIARITAGHETINVELEEDKRNRELYEVYVNPGC